MFNLELKKHRETAGLSQFRLAEKLGVSQATVGMWESGRREPNFSMLCKLADYFDISTDALLGRSEIPGNVPALSASDAALLHKFQALDSRAQARILNAVDFEYRCFAEEEQKIFATQG